MGISVSGQTLEFLYSALFGVGLGVFYDILRVIRSYLGRGKAVTALFDVFFWLFAICSLFGFILTVSAGHMRWYVLLGAFCGGFVYMCTVSELFFKSLRIIISIVMRTLRLSTKPMYMFARWILKTGRRTKRAIIKNAKKSAVTRHKKRAEKRVKKAFKKEKRSKRRAVVKNAGNEKDK